MGGANSGRGAATGAALAILAVANWGMMPVAAKAVVPVLDTTTLNFARFVVAFGLLSVYFFRRRTRLVTGRLAPKHYALIIAGAAGLLCNHLLFFLALRHISAASSQVIVQLGPITLLLGGIAIFHEKFTAIQALGLLLFVVGLVSFFNRALPALAHPGSADTSGILYMVAASLIWTVYGLSLRALVGIAHPALMLLGCYGIGALILLPLTGMDQFHALDHVQAVMLIVLSLSSLAAYILFAESLAYWETSKSSALLALIPVLTLGYERLWAAWLPDYFDYTPLNALAVAGMAMVVVGSLVVTIVRYPSIASSE